MNGGRLSIFACALTALTLAASTATSAPMPSHPLTMGILGAGEINGPDASVAFSRLRNAGMSTISASIYWSGTAPQQEPSSWNPADPGDPHYNWSVSDTQIKAIAAAGFQPIVLVSDAPVWARLLPAASASAPKAEKLGQFMRAAAERYSGKYPGIPRVRYWEIWNEPNISLFFLPQYDSTNGKFVSPDIYRDMVNAAAESIHAVHADNLVIAGSTAPFRDITPNIQSVDNDWGPLKFMRRLLCLDDAGRATCASTVSFDVWATHPYTSGGPTHHAALPYDVSLGDLAKMTATLRAAARTGHIKSSAPVRFWVNEFSWDSRPPDKCSPPMSLLKRWVPEAFYRMWANGVDLIAWFLLMDQPPTVSFYQSGFYFNAPRFASAEPKPFLEAFRFPFVALRRGSGVYVWAHTPFGKRGRVVIQQTFRGGWKQVKQLPADRYGITQAVLKVKPIGQFRAFFGGEKSLPFSMRIPPDRFFNPFGQTTLLEPNGQPCSG